MSDGTNIADQVLADAAADIGYRIASSLEDIMRRRVCDGEFVTYSDTPDSQLTELANLASRLVIIGADTGAAVRDARRCHRLIGVYREASDIELGRIYHTTYTDSREWQFLLDEIDRRGLTDEFLDACYLDGTDEVAGR
jgi:hypothetical protein